MRFEGTLTTWNDDRGFGFVTPVQGGDQIFVHVSAFGGRRTRPQVGERVSFEMEIGPQGRKRGKNVLPVVAPRKRRTRSEGPAEWGTATLFVLPAFLLLYLGLAIAWKLPLLVAGGYLLASIATFVAYAIDKSAAQRGAWRTSEGTLHLMALLGGWPGALIAQQVLRHKSAKGEFRAVFWATVVLNTGALVVLASPLRGLITR